MSALSDADKIRLGMVHQRLIDNGLSALMCTGRELADSLRYSLPDLSDVTVGRVCLAIQEFMEMAQGDMECVKLKLVQTYVTCAGLDLTSAEWQSLGDLS